MLFMLVVLLAPMLLVPPLASWRSSRNASASVDWE
jgi:hypothetical protein